MNIKLIFGIGGIILSISALIETVEFTIGTQWFASAALGWMFSISLLYLLEGIEIHKDATKRTKGE